MSTVVDGQPAEAVLDSPAADTALEMTHVDVVPVQPVNVALNGQSVGSVLDAQDAAAVIEAPAGAMPDAVVNGAVPEFADDNAGIKLTPNGQPGDSDA